MFGLSWPADEDWLSSARFSQVDALGQWHIPIMPKSGTVDDWVWNVVDPQWIVASFFQMIIPAINSINIFYRFQSSKQQSRLYILAPICSFIHPLILLLIHSSIRFLIHLAINSPTHSLTHSFTHSITHPLTHSLTHSLTQSINQLLPHSINQSLTHPLIPSLNQSVTHSPTHSLTQSINQSLTHSINQSLTHSLTHSLIHSLNQSITHSLIHSLIHSLNQSITHSLTHSPTHSFLQSTHRTLLFNRRLPVLSEWRTEVLLHLRLVSHLIDCYFSVRQPPCLPVCLPACLPAVDFIDSPRLLIFWKSNCLIIKHRPITWPTVEQRPSFVICPSRRVNLQARRRLSASVI